MTRVIVVLEYFGVVLRMDHKSGYVGFRHLGRKVPIRMLKAAV